MPDSQLPGVVRHLIDRGNLILARRHQFEDQRGVGPIPQRQKKSAHDVGPVLAAVERIKNTREHNTRKLQVRLRWVRSGRRGRRPLRRRRPMHHAHDRATIRGGNFAFTCSL